MLSRRAFIRSAALASSSLAAGILAYDIRSDSCYTGSPVLEKLTLKLAALPRAFNGYRIGFVTDPHLGMWVPKDWIASAFETLQRLSIDLLVLGGDYIFVSDNPIWGITGAVRNWDYASLSRGETAARAFRDFAIITSQFTFPDGIIGVAGNHDNWNSPHVFHRTMKDFPKIRLLLNEELSIVRGSESISLFGVEDYLTGIPARPPARGESSPRTRILVSHNPDYVAELAKDDPSLFDVALCGHTHGGQVRLPGITGLIVPIQNPDFLAGLTKTGDSFVYTSRGLGVVGLPFRFDCPPEITLLELQQA